MIAYNLFVIFATISAIWVVPMLESKTLMVYNNGKNFRPQLLKILHIFLEVMSLKIGHEYLNDIKTAFDWLIRLIIPKTMCVKLPIVYNALKILAALIVAAEPGIKLFIYMRIGKEDKYRCLLNWLIDTFSNSMWLIFGYVYYPDVTVGIKWLYNRMISPIKNCVKKPVNAQVDQENRRNSM